MPVPWPVGAPVQDNDLSVLFVDSYAAWRCRLHLHGVVEGGLTVFRLFGVAASPSGLRVEGLVFAARFVDTVRVRIGVAGLDLGRVGGAVFGGLDDLVGKGSGGERGDGCDESGRDGGEDAGGQDRVDGDGSGIGGSCGFGSEDQAHADDGNADDTRASQPYLGLVAGVVDRVGVFGTAIGDACAQVDEALRTVESLQGL